MNIRQKITEFVGFVLNDSHNESDLNQLIQKLDELPLLVYCAKFEFDPEDYNDPPTANYSDTRKTINSKFPELGLYHSAQYTDDLECTGELLLGDAVDDLADIVGDLLEIEWYFENTSDANALWHLEMSYRGHWGNHLRELQLYLYRHHY
ncbi:DUF5063 domain-containing protein [Sessilibacter corallicola]|uniref:DUF5063 domain-containing protein n=1 Tax=Sessilibacter corallicola TaxID=2904075 RepID=UPI001E5503CA|nr:DUF5063 domain-containing protein [Sessilibacter corallicola]MCE2029173.1 DUF5063 domain-containing protein [Sessilibacter corallicola]